MSKVNWMILSVVMHIESCLVWRKVIHGLNLPRSFCNWIDHGMSLTRF